MTDRRPTRREKDEQAVLEKIAELPDGDRELVERVHALVVEHAPELAPKPFYGAPGYARDGKVVCFVRSGEKDGERYSTLGFSGHARLDDGAMWPTSYALTTLDDETEARIVELVRRAAG